MSKVRISGIICVIIVGIAALVSLRFDYKYCYIAGALFIAFAIGWGIIFATGFKGFDAIDKRLSSGSKSQLLALLSIVSCVFFLGAGVILCCRPYFDELTFPESSYDAFLHIAHRYFGYNYYQDDSVLNTGTFFLSLFGSLLLGGLLITTFSNIVQQRKEDVVNGLVKYKRIAGHSVIIGSGSYSHYLIRQLLADESKDDRVILMTNHSIPEVRSRLRALLTTWQMEHVTLISGDMTLAEDIHEKLEITKAKDVYIMGESGEYGIDSKNIECAKYVAAARGDGKAVLPVYVHLWHMYSNKYIKANNTPSPIEDNVHVFFRPFNFYENWGRLLWGYNSLERYKPLNYLPTTNEKHVHLVVVGLNHMGAALIIQAARLCHYPHFDGKTKTVISVIEKNPAVVDEFKSMYPGLEKIEDIEIRFEHRPDGTLHTYESFLEELRRLALDDNAILTIAICYRDSDQAISAALRLPEEIYYHKDRIDTKDGKVLQNRMLTQVLVRQEFNNGLGHMLDNDDRYINFHVFGMLSEGLDISLQDDRLAKLAMVNYEALKTNDFRNRVFTLLMSDDSESAKAKEDFWRDAERQWLSASEWERMSNRYQVDMCPVYIAALKDAGLLHCDEQPGDLISESSLSDYLSSGYYKLYPGSSSSMIEGRPDGAPAYEEALANDLAEIEHRRWMAERFIAGWRLPHDGKTRLDQFMIHPLLKPFNTLDDIDKYKDIIVLRNVPLLDAIQKKLANE